MKKLALTLTLLTLLAGGLMAQTDPYGQVDTVYLDQMTVGSGQEFTINVNMFNDEELGGITMPLKYPVDKLEFQEVIFTGGRIDYINTKPVSVDEAAGTILVGAIVFFEAFIAPGDGPIFKIRFRLKDGLTPGETVSIDTTSIPPAHLLLSHSSATNIIPSFRPGIITVAEANSAPVFAPISDYYIAEGESLYIDLSVNDPDGDAVAIANPIHPINSSFVDHGDGTARLSWKPDFVGPTSSEQSPFEFVFWASDGILSNTIQVYVNVINVNRAPQIDAPALIQAEAGDSLGIVISGSDPDFENITWDIDGLPAGATFDFGNPGLINWVTDYGDTGNYLITVTASDPSGLSASSQIEIDLAPVSLYVVRIDTISGYPGHIVDLGIYLKNKQDVSAFELLMNFDAALLYPLDVTNIGTRAENFESFEYRINDGGNNGDVRITGQADLAGGAVGQPIGEGDGLIAIVRVQISSNLSYVGSLVPVRFVTYGATDNTLTDGNGNEISDESINLFDGHIFITSSGTTRLGDINLNGLAYEISDAVYFSNFFISPKLSPLNDQQLLNSDINRDGFAPSVADLVLMIQIIAGIVEPPLLKVLPSPSTAVVELVRDPSGIFLETDSPADIGGAYFQFQGADVNLLWMSNLTEMELKSGIQDDRLSCLMISYDKKTISFGRTSVIKLSDDPNLDISLQSADLADAEGRVMNIELKGTPMLPGCFALYQNSPNPFNPATEIRFDLDRPARVTLAVFNILGQEVIRLADCEYPAGTHSVVWDGADANGNSVASGVYLYRLNADGHNASRKMILMK